MKIWRWQIKGYHGWSFWDCQTHTNEMFIFTQYRWLKQRDSVKCDDLSHLHVSCGTYTEDIEREGVI
jgi:hypothetical protein